MNLFQEIGRVLYQFEGKTHLAIVLMGWDKTGEPCDLAVADEFFVIDKERRAMIGLPARECRAA